MQIKLNYPDHIEIEGYDLQSDEWKSIEKHLADKIEFEFAEEGNNNYTYIIDFDGCIFKYSFDKQDPGYNITIERPVFSGVVFFGGKNTSGVIDLVKKSFAEKFTHDLFWNFIPYKEYIIDGGELEVLLRDKTGKIIQQVPMEPPYEYKYEGNDIIVECTLGGIYGKQVLTIPD